MSNVAECLLKYSPEVLKADMATASVLLGLLPTILSLAGSSTVEVGLVALQRPLLALLLGTASPAVNPLRTFDYGAPASLMARKAYSAEPPRIPAYLRQLVSGMQYALALAAIYNIAMVTYSLSIQTYSVSNQYVPIVLIWICLAIFIHILGAVALRLRVKLIVKNPLGISTALKNEFLLSAYHPESRLAFQQESYWFISLSWATSVATIIHIAMGTLVLSSLLFINVQDAMFVAFRCLGSACVSRVIVMFELSNMRTNVHVDNEHSKVEELRVAYRSPKEHVVECRSRIVDACSSP
ncbi:hypothetical protein ABVK25_000888 [Lepraria finkii]|uniref:Uncharacterized protein n=1 Tax=Lepraria finkii TaxID=1340010 RepID=A0ABR4BPF5_9LECA